eukprot:scaffold4786_cov198-Amphora_coffeaeformis.AAC.10
MRRVFLTDAKQTALVSELQTSEKIRSSVYTWNDGVDGQTSPRHAHHWSCRHPAPRRAMVPPFIWNNKR